jgi:biopolymer transport protein ExbD
MADQPKRFFDVWFLAANTVTKEVPFHVVTDWVQQGKVTPDDRVKPSGTADWFQFGSVQAFQPYFPQPEELRANDMAEALEPVEFELDWKKSTDDEDDDVDMIPLIDISLVLLIFFMMTATVAAISHIKVPDAAYANPSTETDLLRIDIDLRDGKPVYSLGIGTTAPAVDDDNLDGDVALKLRLDEKLKNLSEPPKVRIAAHGDIPFEVVEEVLKALDSRLEKNQIREYAVEVNERPK